MGQCICRVGPETRGPRPVGSRGRPRRLERHVLMMLLMMMMKLMMIVMLLFVFFDNDNDDHEVEQSSPPLPHGFTETSPIRQMKSNQQQTKQSPRQDSNQYENTHR